MEHITLCGKQVTIRRDADSVGAFQLDVVQTVIRQKVLECPLGQWWMPNLGGTGRRNRPLYRVGVMGKKGGATRKEGE